jgi:hypothetical protein
VLPKNGSGVGPGGRERRFQKKFQKAKVVSRSSRMRVNILEFSFYKWEKCLAKKFNFFFDGIFMVK